jgi:hypothetical protein
MNKYLAREFSYEDWVIKYPEDYLEGFKSEAISEA